MEGQAAAGTGQINTTGIDLATNGWYPRPAVGEVVELTDRCIQKNVGLSGHQPHSLRAMCISLSGQGYVYPTKMSLFLHTGHGAVVQRTMDIHGPANIRCASFSLRFLFPS